MAASDHINWKQRLDSGEFGRSDAVQAQDGTVWVEHTAPDGSLVASCPHCGSNINSNQIGRPQSDRACVNCSMNADEALQKAMRANNLQKMNDYYASPEGQAARAEAMGMFGLEG